MTAAHVLAERDRRWWLADRLMEHAGVDALVVRGLRHAPGRSTPDEWLSGATPGSVVFKAHGEPPLSIRLPWTLGPAVAEPPNIGWLPPDNILFGRVVTNVVEAARARGLQDAKFGTVGITPEPPLYFGAAHPSGLWRMLAHGLNPSALVPLDDEFNAMMTLHGAEEIDALGWIAAVGEIVCESIRSSIRPGVDEAQLRLAAAEARQRHDGFVVDVELTVGDPLADIGRPHYVTSGDIVRANITTSRGSLRTHSSAMIAVGEIHPDVERAARAAEASYEAGLRLLRAGVSLAEVMEAMREPLRGLDSRPQPPVSRAIDEPPPRPPSTLPPPPLDDVTLEPGMSLVLQPCCTHRGHYASLGGTVLVGLSGALELNRTTARLMHACL